jgi:hypothetical protein
MLNEVDVYFQKIKYKHLGEQGIISLNYDYISGRFNQAGRDQSNWLVEDTQQILKEFYEPEKEEASF